MKYLKIDNGEGLFLQDKEKREYKPLSEMIGTDICRILLLMGDDDDVSFDDNIHTINNDATRIVYDNLLNRFKDFSEKKDAIRSEIDCKYKPLEEKYL